MITIVLGLIGLGIVVFVHELGHFIAARLTGVEVEAFSLGWGPKLAGFVRGNTEYRISVFPIGGYCRMKGEESYRAALERGDESMPKESGSFYGASPWRRIIIALAGPGANLLFAILVAILIAAVGYDIKTFGNRVILASDYPFPGESPSGMPAETAGIKTGDRIVAINGRNTVLYSQIQEIIARSAEKPLRFTVDRDSRNLELVVVPALDSETATGRVGLYAWIDAVIDKVTDGSSAYIAGLESGDRIVSVNGIPIDHAIAFQKVLIDKPSTIHLTFERGGVPLETDLVPAWDKRGNPDIGISFKYLTYRMKAEGFLDAVSKGLDDAGKTISATLLGLASLFGGHVNVMNAVSGPLRITYMVGTVASQGLQEGIASGLSQIFSFLSLLSIGVFIMNLMPIPLLDGGQIVLFVIEGARRKPLKIKTVYRYQVIGMAVVLAIFLLTTVADVSFFSGR